MKTKKRVFMVVSVIVLCLSFNANNCVKADNNIFKDNTTTILTLSKHKIVLDKGKKIKITANKKVKWKSSNKKIATISKKGVLKVKKNGKVTITATSKNTNETAKVTVYCGGYKISKKRFPDKGFREYVKSVDDRNDDGYLSNKERRKPTVMYLDTTELLGEPGGKKLYNKIQKIKSLKGIEYFENLQGVSINNVKGLKNIDLSNLKKLKVFEIVGKGVKNITANNCPNLIGFEIDITGDSLKNVSAVNCPKLGVALDNKLKEKLENKTALEMDNKVTIFGTFGELNIVNSPIAGSHILVFCDGKIIK